MKKLIVIIFQQLAAITLSTSNLCGQHNCGEPKWSSDGENIVFIGSPASENIEGTYPTRREIMIMKADGSEKRKITSNPNFSDAYPTLSPDGKTILFSSNRDGSWKLFTVNIDGTDERDLGMESTSSVWNDPCRAEWSPDGRQFCFPKNINGSRILHIANRDGSGVKAISSEIGIYPHWSGDGKSIAFFRKGNIHTINADGTNYRQVTNNTDPTSQETRAIYPQWSTDDKYLFYIKGEHIFRIKPDGTDEKQITTSPGQKWYLGVSSKNKIIYSTIDKDKDELFVADVDGKNARCVTK